MKIFLKLSNEQHRPKWVKLETNNFFISYTDRYMSAIYGKMDEATHKRFWKWFIKC